MLDPIGYGLIRLALVRSGVISVDRVYPGWIHFYFAELCRNQGNLVGTR